jgi:hypothetical protein
MAPAICNLIPPSSTDGSTQSCTRRLPARLSLGWKIDFRKITTARICRSYASDSLFGQITGLFCVAASRQKSYTSLRDEKTTGRLASAATVTLFESSLEFRFALTISRTRSKTIARRINPPKKELAKYGFALISINPFWIRIKIAPPKKIPGMEMLPPFKPVPPIMATRHEPNVHRA